MASLEADGEFAEQLFVHGLGVQTAEGMAEWLHARVRSDLGIAPGAGPPLLVGLPVLPGAVRADQGLPRCSTRRRSACSCPAGFAVEPEQSTLAIVAHHPQAVYFGMRNGSLPATSARPATS